MNRTARIAILSISILVFCYAGIGHVLGRTPDDKAYKSLTVYSEVLQKIQTDYVDEPNMHQVAAGSMRGLLESLDPQSSYLTPREYSEYKEKSEHEGIGTSGLTLSKRYGYIIVVSVLPDSPAEKAGIISGDILESVGGFTTREMSVGQAMNLLTGQQGTGVKVSVIRRGRTDPQGVEIVREKLTPAKVLTQKTDPDILALRIPSLNAGSADDVRTRMQDAEKQGIHKVILDLRDCGEGTDSEGIALARLFISNGTLATLKGQTVSTRVFSAEPNKVAWSGPLSILVDGTTSGAAEVFASAISANHRGEVVGERTFGLASEQKLITLDDGSAIILTVANYYNAEGKPILDEGVAPTQVVHPPAPPDDEDVVDGNGNPPDTQDDQKGLVAPPEPKPLSPEDTIYRRALDLLKAPPASEKKAA
jgi:carboxyl-terminal processing protease